MSEQHRKVVPGLHVTQNEEGDEYDSSQHQHRKPLAVFTRLKKQSTEKILTPEIQCSVNSYWLYKHRFISAQRQSTVQNMGSKM